MSKPDNPNAFPRAGYTVEDNTGVLWTEHSNDGMTLRDYFAGQALIGLLAGGFGGGGNGRCELAYVYADNMLAEREKVKP